MHQHPAQKSVLRERERSMAVCWAMARQWHIAERGSAERGSVDPQRGSGGAGQAEHPAAGRTAGQPAAGRSEREVWLALTGFHLHAWDTPRYFR